MEPKRVLFQPFLPMDLPCDRQPILRVHLCSTEKGILQDIVRNERHMNYKPVLPKDILETRGANTLTLSCTIEGNNTVSTKIVNLQDLQHQNRVETLVMDLNQCPDDSMVMLTLNHIERREIRFRTGYSSNSTLPTTMGRVVNTGITDIDLRNLSKDIPNNKVEALGILLQIPVGDVSRYMINNANFEMLYAWKMKTKWTEQITVLVKALEAEYVNLGYLAEKYFPDYLQRECLSAHQEQQEETPGKTSRGISVPPEIHARGPEAQLAYEKAARDGMRKINRTRLMILGQYRVGKTSLKRVLTGKKFQVKEPITYGANATDLCKICVDMTTPTETVWTIQDKPTREARADECNNAFAHDITKQLVTLPSESVHDDPTVDKDRTPFNDDQNEDEEPVAAHLSQAPSQGRATIPARGSDMMPAPIASLVEEILKSGSEDEEGKPSLSIWDFAGQDIFYTTHQIFLTWRAVYIIVFDLSRDLDSDAVLRESADNVETAEISTSSEMKCIDYIRFWLCSIFAHAVKPSSLISAPSNIDQEIPPIFIVGTHRESLEGDANERAKLVQEAFKKIDNLVKDKPFVRHVIPEYYPIDSSLENADKMLHKLRRHIESVTKVPEEIPLKYLLFEKSLAAFDCNYVTLDKIEKITRSFGVERGRELLTMLNFYNDIGYIVYFGDIEDIEDAKSPLRDIVILNPQWLIDVFESVITIAPRGKRKGKLNDAWMKLENEGILEDRLIEDVWQGFLEHKDALIMIMVKFDLMCEKPVTETSPSICDDEVNEKSRDADTIGKCYYVPSRLTRFCSDKEIVGIVSPLIFYVDFNGFLPEGLFHRLMVRAVRWMEGKEGLPIWLFYRRISLLVDEHHHALLDMLSPKEATIKVTVYHLDNDKSGDEDSESPDPSAVYQITTFVDETLSSLIREWARRIKFDIRFACPKCEKKIPLNNCLGKTHLICKQDGSTIPHRFDVEPVKKSFGLPAGPTDPGPLVSVGDDVTRETSEDVPNMNKMNNGIKPIVLLNLSKNIPNSKVATLGTVLKIPEADIERFQKTNENFPCNSDGTHLMLKSWKASKRAAEQIPELVAALKAESVGLTNLAEKYFPDHVLLDLATSDGRDGTNSHGGETGESAQITGETSENIARNRTRRVSANTSQPPITSGATTAGSASRATKNLAARWFNVRAAFAVAIVAVTIALVDFCVIGSPFWSCFVHMRQLGVVCVVFMGAYTFLSQYFAQP